MSLAIFDLDNTLLGGDSDYLWGQFLVEKGIVDRKHYEEANARFYEDYKNGTLDIVEFLEFALSPLADNQLDALHGWRAAFIEEKIRPILLPAATALIEKHRRAGDVPIIITATNRFVTEPIARLYGVEHLIATTPELENGHYTGRFVGTPCFREGKVQRLKEWLGENDHDLANSWFYSDSHNDLPLLSLVGFPVAVDPDEKLETFAARNSWPVISLRNGSCPEDHARRLKRTHQALRIK
ncbi:MULTISPECIES: histidinol-phosphatase [Methylocaldum]|uniref:histidinol-phosphatase n=1 Tax=unclassified Methylocaldum TaxID=2622260 RepID=UPI00098B6835|nr:HAD family hydrolase [Methylocaldum sp. 14B]MVF24576.1 HAD family hydrolase [Methylocaldum sp. BRCS4]